MRLAIDRGRNAMSLGIDSSSRYPTPLRRSAAFDERGDLQLASGERRPIVAGCILPHEMQTECERLRGAKGHNLTHGWPGAGCTFDTTFAGPGNPERDRSL